MRMYDIIAKKKKGEELTDEEIRFFVNGFTNGEIPDYQASALAMAVCFNSMTDRETATLTDAMAHSGDTVDLSEFGDLSVDKHSTGGVGDKTSLIVAPIVASCGAKIAKMSGRGLGHTGGTVDKLESIEGFKTDLSIDDFFEQTRNIGISIIGQTGNMTPADKKLYALRDVTATVDSIPLIVSSIMSKKLAAGAKTIALDVKCGSGAFMQNIESATELAQKMVDIGKRCGRNMAALITNMDIPLGRAVGNSLEVIEAASVLKGETDGDLKEICLALASNIISLCFNIAYEQAFERANNALVSGLAYSKFKEWISYQGGNIEWIENTDMIPKAKYTFEVKAEQDGWMSAMDTAAIGNVSSMLGAGRVTKDDVIDFSAGIIINKKTGDCVKCGETLCTLYTNNELAIADAQKMYLGCVSISSAPVDKPMLIFDRIV